MQLEAGIDLIQGYIYSDWLILLLTALLLCPAAAKVDITSATAFACADFACIPQTSCLALQWQARSMATLSRNALSRHIPLTYNGPHLPVRHLVRLPGDHITRQRAIFEITGDCSKTIVAFVQQEGRENLTWDPPSPQELPPVIAAGREGQLSCHACPGAHTLPASCTRRTPTGNKGVWKWLAIGGAVVVVTYFVSKHGRKGESGSCRSAADYRQAWHCLWGASFLSCTSLYQTVQ